MPQMAPMMWIPMTLIFILVILMMTSLIYPMIKKLKSETLPNNLNYKLNPDLKNWKW